MSKILSDRPAAEAQARASRPGDGALMRPRMPVSYSLLPPVLSGSLGWLVIAGSGWSGQEEFHWLVDQIRRTGTLFRRLLALAMLPVAVAFAADYFVDSGFGRDDSTGLSAASPWRTISRVNRAQLRAGDRVLFRRGGVWRERLIPPASGTSDLPITFSGYGEGSAPVLDGSVLLDDFVPISGYPSVLATGAAWNVHAVWEDSTTLLRPARSIPAVASLPGSWFWSAGTLFIHPSDSSSKAVRSRTYEAAHIGPIIDNARSYVTFNGLTVRHAAQYAAISLYSSREITGVLIENCDISYNYPRGIWSAGPNTVSKLIIRKNVISQNAGSGIEMEQSHFGVIEDNAVTANCLQDLLPYQAGIRLWSPKISNTLVARNTVSIERQGYLHDESIGIHIDEVGPGVVVQENMVSDTDAAGIEIENCGGVLVYANVCVRTRTGIFLYRGARGHRVYHNTVYASASQGITVQGDGVPGGVFDNVLKNNISAGSRYAELKAVYGGDNDGLLGWGNSYRNNSFGPERPELIQWGTWAYSSYSTWSAVSGSGSSAPWYVGEPGFIDASTANFQLMPTSIAVNNAEFLPDVDQFNAGPRGLNLGALPVGLYRQ
jgi:hypothetical protein